MQDKFDKIRPYLNHEIQAVFSQLVANDEVLQGAGVVMPSELIEDFLQNYEQIADIDSFQKRYMLPMLENLKKIKRTEITFSEIEHYRPSALLLSNHRDIIMDSAFLQYVLVSNGFRTSEIAIGNNLMAKPWITAAMRINKSFIVRRNLTKGEQISAFVELSSYIANTITTERNSIWLAHREGRAKDSDDRTQVSLLKMLALSGKGSFIENLKTLNIQPLSISYEYDACDYLKAKELQQKRDNPYFEKSTMDDVKSMQIGALGFASTIHYSFTPTINDELDKISMLRLPRNKEVELVAELIDRQIHKAYKIYKSNYIAYDMLKGEKFYESFYNSEEKTIFANYIAGQVSKIDLDNVDKEFCTEKILEMYANPLKNKLSADLH
ncbi:MAG: 1-acyl-sn-glycerol-3-phosphate acyltransferase [Porphyromonadaceae bacterium]|nr:1-acyl-sn-glycerol-3-phosphate acyltransferase [Porphyromonadaceae bacterium]